MLRDETGWEMGESVRLETREGRREPNQPLTINHKLSENLRTYEPLNISTLKPSNGSMTVTISNTITQLLPIFCRFLAGYLLP